LSHLGKQVRLDKLVQVWRKNGEEAWVLVHIEVQSQKETGFAERMYLYHLRPDESGSRFARDLFN
jgi:hypothetical protein